MTERPIIFSAPMVRAILDNRKTQTRRVVKPQPDKPTAAPIEWSNWHRAWIQRAWQTAGSWNNGNPIKCPHGVPSDHLYVKEATWIWCEKRPNGTTKTGRQKYRYAPIGEHVRYCADMPHSDSRPVTPVDSEPQRLWRWKSARFMPKWASRITLEIKDVRVQRVQEISEEDAISEGVGVLPVGFNRTAPLYRAYDDPEQGWRCLSARESFHTLWDSINSKRDGGIYAWAVNPFAWALTFKRIEVSHD